MDEVQAEIGQQRLELKRSQAECLARARGAYLRLSSRLRDGTVTIAELAALDLDELLVIWTALNSASMEARHLVARGRALAGEAAAEA